MNQPLSYRVKDLEVFLEELDYNFNQQVNGAIHYNGLTLIYGRFTQVNGEDHNQIVGVDADGELVDVEFPSVSSAQRLTDVKIHDGKLYVMRIFNPAVSGNHTFQLYEWDGTTWELISNTAFFSVSTTSASDGEIHYFNDRWYAFPSNSGTVNANVWELIDGSWVQHKDSQGGNNNMSRSAVVFDDALYFTSHPSNVNGRVRKLDSNNDITVVSDGPLPVQFASTDNYLYMYYHGFLDFDGELFGEEDVELSPGLWAWDGNEFFFIVDGDSEFISSISLNAIVGPGAMPDSTVITWAIYVDGGPLIQQITETEDGWSDVQDFATNFQTGQSRVVLSFDTQFFVFAGALANPTVFGNLLDFDSTLDFDVELLPFEYTPVEEQVRVFHNDIELTTDEWTFEDGVLTADIVPEIGDTLIAFRETRWDHSWVQFQPTSRIRRNRDLRTYYKQRLFILQEICELQEVASFTVPLPPDPPYVFNPDRPGNQLVTEVDGPIDVEIELLPFSIAGDLRHQVVVQGLFNGEGNPMTIPFVEEDPDENEWTVNEFQQIVIGDNSFWGNETHPIIIRRRTNRKKLVHQVFDASSFSSTEIKNIDAQIRFLLEEDWCPIPLFPDGHPLGNNIFPRALNFLSYVGPGSIFSFAQFQWLPGEFFVFVNNIPIEDFNLDFFNWELEVPELGDGDVLTFGPGGGAYGNPGIAGNFGSDQEGEDPPPPPPPPPIQFPPPQWPPLDLGLLYSVAPFSYTFGFTGWQGEGGFGPGGAFQGPSVGFKYFNHITGQQFIHLGRPRTLPHESGKNPFVYLWSYTSSNEGQTWSHFHALTQDVPVTAPGWVAEARSFLISTLPTGHPIRQLMLESSGLILIDVDPDTDQWTFASEKMNGLNSFMDDLKAALGTTTLDNVTQQDLLDFYTGNYTLPPPPEEPE